MERYDAGKEVERLENLLDGRRITFKSVLKIGLVTALAFLPALPVKAYVDSIQAACKTQAETEINRIRQESIDQIFDVDYHPQYAKEISRVAKEQGVPEYILQAIVDDQRHGFECMTSSGDGWIRNSVTDVAARNVGIRMQVLDKDPEMAIRAAAISYKDCLEECGDEAEALIMYGCINQSPGEDWKARIKKAKSEAEKVQRSHDKYEQIKKDPRYAELVMLVEQMYDIDNEIGHISDDPKKSNEWMFRYSEIAQRRGKEKLCQRIKEIAEREFPEDDYFRWYLVAKYDNEESRWWVNNAPYDSLVKRAIKIRQSRQ